MTDPQSYIQSDRQDISPWTEIPFLPLPARDPTRGGQFLSDAREINIGDGGNNVFRVNKDGLWLGAASFVDAPFSVSMLGEMIANSLTIVGGSIVGAIFKTSATGARVVIDGSGVTKRLYTVDAGGNEVVTIYADTGAHGISIAKASGSGIENCLRITDSDDDIDDTDNGTIFISVTPGAASQKAILSMNAGNSNYEGQFIKIVSSGTHDASGKQMIDISPGSADARVFVIGSFTAWNVRGDGRQTVAWLGVGTTTPTTSAGIEIATTTQALLLSRLTTTQRDALTPTNGMLIYNTTAGKFQGYEAGAWANLI